MNTSSDKKHLTLSELIQKLQKIEASLPFEGKVGCYGQESIYPTGVIDVEWDRSFNTAIIEFESSGEDEEH
jgi:hypothetical protein